MIKKVFLTIMIGSGLFISACNTPTQSTNTSQNNTQNNPNELITIEGMVNDPNDQPVADVKIVIKEDDKVLANAVTNGKGEFSVRVPKVFGDSYFIEATKALADGTLDQTLLITAGQKADFVGKDKLRKTLVASKPAPIQ